MRISGTKGRGDSDLRRIVGTEAVRRRTALSVRRRVRCRDPPAGDVRDKEKTRRREELGRHGECRDTANAVLKDTANAV